MFCHNSADPVPTSNLICIKMASILTSQSRDLKYGGIFSNHCEVIILSIESPARLKDQVHSVPDTPILGSSDSAANKDTISKTWTNGDTIISLSRKHCGKRRNCSLRAISPFPTMFPKVVCC